MIKFTATIFKFGSQREKTGWTCIKIPAEIALQLKPGNKKSFRVKGKLDHFPIKQIALLPVGDGDFVMALNAGIRKKLGKRSGEKVIAQLELDQSALINSKEFIKCLKDEPEAFEYFNKLAPSHQYYYTKWIESAKTPETKANRIANAVNFLLRKQGFSELLRSLKDERKELLR